MSRRQAPRISPEDLRVHVVPVRDGLGLIDRGEIVQALNIAPLTRYLLGRCLGSGPGPAGAPCA